MLLLLPKLLFSGFIRLIIGGVISFNSKAIVVEFELPAESFAKAVIV